MGRMMRVLCRPAQGIDYEDLESTLGTLGVIAALVLTLVTALQYSYQPSNMQFADFRSLSCSSQKFRSYAVDVMQTWDIGTYKQEFFNFSMPLPGGATLDIKHEFLKGIAQRVQENDGKAVDWSDHWNTGDLANMKSCMVDTKSAAAIAALFSDFPQKFLTVYRSMMHNREEDGIVWSQLSIKTITVSFTLTASALLGSTLLYLSLIFSPAKEDTSGKALQAWSRYGSVGIVYIFVLANLGLLLFMMSHSTLTVLDSANLAQSFDANVLAYVTLGWPLAGVGTLLSIVSIISSWCSQTDNTDNKVPGASSPCASPSDAVRVERGCATAGRGAADRGVRLIEVEAEDFEVEAEELPLSALSSSQRLHHIIFTASGNEHAGGLQGKTT